MYFEEEFCYELPSRGKRRHRKHKCFIWGEEHHHDDCGCGLDRGGRCDIRSEKDEGKRRHERDERSERDRHHEKDCCCFDRGNDHCKGCACEQLRNLARNTPILFTTGEAQFLLPATFISFNHKTCCADLRVGTSDVVVDCRDIKVLLIQNT